MKKHIEDDARKAKRISDERHLDLNRLMKEHFCEQESDRGMKKSKKKKGKK